MKSLFNVSHIVLKEKKDIIYTVIFGVGAGIIGVSLFGASGYVISKAALIPPLYTLTIMLALLKLFGIARAVSRYGERYYSHRATFTILGNLRTDFFKKLELLSPSILQSYRSGELLARIVGDVENLQNFFLRVFYPPIVFVFVFVGTIFFLTFYSTWISVLLAIGMILTGFIIPAIFAWYQYHIKQSIYKFRGNLSAELTEFLYGFQDLKIHQKVRGKQEKLSTLSEHHLQEQEKKQNLENTSQSWNMFISMIICWALSLVSVYQVTQGELSGLFLAMLIMVSLNVFEYAIPMAAFPAYYEDSRYSSDKLLSVVKSQPEISKAQGQYKKLESDLIEIHMRDVSFTFPTESRTAIKNISLTFPKGSKTAIVGPSGSGKSTLLQLLMKIYNPTKGEIYFNKQSVKELRQTDIWLHTNTILQENHFFYGTIRENLLLANDCATDEKLKQALKAAELDTCILNNQVLEKGENLSGGERQKLAFARVFLKERSLWLLDEPFSSLDLLTQKKIMQMLLRKAEKSTVIFVSHQLAQLEEMDQIIVMDEGRIIEVGSFLELTNKKGYFYKLKELEENILF
jgi:ATP-binding cassette subfamily C protein CydC